MCKAQPQITDVERANLPVLMSTKQTAALTGTTDKFVRDMCANGGFKAVKLGGVWRVNRDALLAQCGLA